MTFRARGCAVSRSHAKAVLTQSLTTTDPGAPTRVKQMDETLSDIPVYTPSTGFGSFAL